MIAYVLTKHVQPSQTFVTNEIAEMRRQGVEVAVVSVEHGEQQDDSVLYLADLAPSRYAVLRAHTALLLRRPGRYGRFLRHVLLMRREMGTRPEQVPWLLVPLVARRLERQGVQHLHAHFAWSGAACAALLAAALGLPWSVTLHAKDVFSKQRHLRHKLASADVLVTVCRYNEDWMRENLGLARPVHQVVCGVEVPERPWPQLPGADVVTVGRLVPKKGVDVLVRAAALARQELPGLTVDVVGDGPCLPELEALVRELGLEDVVRFLGARGHEESLARIAGARVFALACRVADDGDRDSMPVVIKEAMVREVPVVASGVVAVPEMLGDGCGVMVPPDDPPALAAALLGLLSDSDTARSTAVRGRARAVSSFTLEAEVAKLRELLLPTQQNPAPERAPRWT